MAQILITDDNKDLRTLFRLMLADYEVKEAKNGIEAIDLCKENSFDLILMDILMPEMDGIDATKKIVNIHPNITILGITAYSNRAEEIIEAGAKDVLIKPITKNEFMEKIKEYLQS